MNLSCKAQDGSILRCICNYSFETSRYESLSAMLNEELIKLSPGRPSAVLVRKLIITDCPQSLRLLFDLGSLNRRLAAVNYITFENMDNLSLRFESLQVPEDTFVFTDINNLRLTGAITGQSALQFFFRDLSKDRETNILFDGLQISGNVQLLNFQDIASLSVEGTRFGQLNEVDFFHVDRCYSAAGSRDQVACRKEDLFTSSRPTPSSTRYPPWYSTTATTTRYPPWSSSSTRYPWTTRWSTNPTRSTTTFYTTLRSTEATALPYTDVTSNPLFIVGMVLLAAIVLIGVPIIFFIRHQNRRAPSVELFG